MKHRTRTLLLLVLSAGLAAGCQDASTPEPELPGGAPDVEQAPELPDPQAARSVAEVWTDMRREWAAIQELAADRIRSVEKFEQMELALARLEESVVELERSSEKTGIERIQLGRSIMVLRGSMLDLDRTLAARVPGRLPESLNRVASQLWVVQEMYPEGALPGEPLPKPEGIGMPRS